METVIVEKEVPVEQEIVKVVEKEVVVTATPEPVDERGTFRMAHWSTWAGKESLDPLSPTRYLAAVYFLYDRLCGRDEKGLPVPELAVSWEADATTQRWTFKLREGVKFHDGKPFTSADVAYTFQHIFDPELESPVAAVLDIVDSEAIETPDDHTVVFNLKSRHADFPLLLTDYRVRMIPEGGLDTIEENPIGTGPFKPEKEVDITYAKRGLGAFLRRLGGVPEPPNTVSGITLTIHRGETLALVGESGSGKSTIARTIAGLLPPRAGRLSMEEQDLSCVVERRPAELRRRIQLVFQNPGASLNPRHTVRQILDMPLRLYFRLSREQRLQRSVLALERVRLSSPYVHRFPGQLSGGEQQRVAVARAFVADPEIVLCDEVTSALDVSVQAAVLNLLADLRADQGVAYLFISHDLAVVRAIADRVAVLYQGRLCELGPVEQIYTPPYHPYTETLLAAVPEPVPGVRARLLAKDVQESEPPVSGCPFQRRCPRRVGSICDEETPPWQAAAEEHFIGCHIPLAELRAMETIRESKSRD